MHRIHWPVIALALTAPLLAASMQTASATPGTGGKNNPARAAHASASSKQPGTQPAAFTQYQQVSSGLLTDPTNLQVVGTAFCPTGTKVLSGGAIISSSSLAENINSSIPAADGHSWNVWVNNTSGIDGTFTVYAVCVRKIAQYVIVTGGLSPDPPNLNESNQLPAVCPKPTVEYGGGGYIASPSPFTMMASAEPGYAKRTWWSAFNNRSADTTTDQTYAVCALPLAGYVVVHGVTVTDPSGAQAGASVSCPAGDVVLGGGGSPINFWEGRTDMNSSGPASSTSWSYWENNNSSTQVSIESSAVCATFSG